MVRWIKIVLAGTAATGLALAALAALPGTAALAAEPVVEAWGATGYYVQPGGCCNMGASLYPCPRPTPPWVGHTYISYAPLNPHEFLYPHHNRYVQSHCGGKTVTRVHYRR